METKTLFVIQNIVTGNYVYSRGNCIELKHAQFFPTETAAHNKRNKLYHKSEYRIVQVTINLTPTSILMIEG